MDALPTAFDFENQPWLVQNGEPQVWYERFRAYLALGRTRNVSIAYREEYPLTLWNSNQKWQGAAREWHWIERAQAWDRYQDLLREEAERLEKLQARGLRRDILNTLGVKLADALGRLPYEITWRTAGEVAHLVTSGLRAEYNDMPTQHVQNTVTAKMTQEITTIFVQAFVDVNEIADPAERQVQFVERLRSAQEQIGAAG